MIDAFYCFSYFVLFCFYLSILLPILRMLARSKRKKLPSHHHEVWRSCTCNGTPLQLLILTAGNNRLTKREYTSASLKHHPHIYLQEELWTLEEIFFLITDIIGCVYSIPHELKKLHLKLYLLILKGLTTLWSVALYGRKLWHIIAMCCVCRKHISAHLNPQNAHTGTIPRFSRLTQNLKESLLLSETLWYSKCTKQFKIHMADF